MKKLIRLISAAMVIAMAFCLVSCGAPKEEEPEEKTVKAVIVKQLDHASLDEIANAIEAQLKAEALAAGAVLDVETVSGQNDPTVIKQLAEQAIAKDADVIIPIATLAAQVCASSAEGTGIPVIYAAISDPEGAGLVGLERVYGTSDALNTATIFDMIFAADSAVSKVGLLYSLSETNSEAPIAEAKGIISAKGLIFTEATANTPDEVKAAVSLLITAGVDAIFTPTDNVIMAAELAIYEDLKTAGIPHYAGADSFVRNGAFATCGVNYTDLGKKTGELAFQAALDPAKDFGNDFYLMEGGIITVNTETAEALGMDYSEFGQIGEVVEVITTED
jgi:putative ABC transport system substrate-binding protein